MSEGRARKAVHQRAGGQCEMIDIRYALCKNEIENEDLTCTPCTGRLTFGPDDIQASCDTCGAWCGALVAAYEDPAVIAENARLLDALDQACASAALEGAEISEQWKERVGNALMTRGGLDNLIAARIAEVQVVE